MIEENNFENALECDFCFKLFEKSPGDLNGHIDNIHKKSKSHQCDKCDKSFKTFRTFKIHLSSSHKYERKFKCYGCKKAFGKMKNLILHIEFFHRGPRGYLCEFCDKLFKDEGTALQDHFKYFHYLKQTHECTGCQATFVKSSELELHMDEAHKGPKGYICDFCDILFVTAPLLQNHFGSFHGKKEDTSDKDEIIEPYSCLGSSVPHVHG